MNPNVLSHFIAIRSWRLGDSIVKEVVDYTHLSIVCNLFINSSVNIDDTCHKLKSTILGLLNVGVHESGPRPLMFFKLHKSIGLQRASMAVNYNQKLIKRSPFR